MQKNKISRFEQLAKQEWQEEQPDQLSKVSVVMATYNAEEYLRAAIDSVLKQTHSNFEFIIVDDGSTDSTPEILASYSDQRIVRFRNPKNIGQTKSLNHAIRKLACGDYIARVDADDLAEPRMLEVMSQYLDQHPHIGVVGSARYRIKSDGSVIELWTPPLDNASIQQTMLYWNALPHGGAMFRKSCLAEIGEYSEDLRFAQDYDLALRITERWDARNLDKPFYRERIHNNRVSVTHQTEQDAIADLIRRDTLKRRLITGLKFWNVNDASRFNRATRRWRARRFTWWSASARMVDRRYALAFLLISLAYYPFEIETWAYVKGIFRRKLMGDSVSS